MNPEVSRRLGWAYSLNFKAITKQQWNEIFPDIVLDAETMEELPMWVQEWVVATETKFGLHPAIDTKYEIKGK